MRSGRRSRARTSAAWSPSPATRAPWRTRSSCFYRDRALAERAGANARALGLSFDRRGQVTRYMDLFRQILASPAPEGSAAGNRPALTPDLSRRRRRARRRPGGDRADDELGQADPGCPAVGRRAHPVAADLGGDCARHQARRRRRRVLQPGARGGGWTHFSRAQVPVDGPGRRGAWRASGGRRRSADYAGRTTGCAPPRWTNCRNFGVSFAAT